MQFCAEDLFRVFTFALVVSVLLETERAVQYDSKVDRVCIVIKLKIIPCNTEFAFGVTVPVCLCRVRLQVVTRVVQGHFVKGQL